MNLIPATGDTYPHDLSGVPADPPTMPTPDEVEEGRQALDRLAAAGARLITDAQEPGEVVRGAAPWRLAGALVQLREEANATNPGRDKRSDGTVGDLAHSTRVSDHNPNGAGVVRALDLDVDGLDLASTFERARQLAAAGQLPQVRNGGYFILNRRITAPDFSGWNVYTGPNPHTAHGHASAAVDPASYDITAPWGVFTGTPAPAPAPVPVQPPPRLAWPLPAGHWFGNVAGGARQHGGHPRYDSQATRDFVRNIQQWVIWRGCVPGIASADWRHGWADGLWENATDGPVIEWHRRFYPGQPYPAQIWRDDYGRLTS